jgi:hypothetical protein
MYPSPSSPSLPELPPSTFRSIDYTHVIPIRYLGFTRSILRRSYGVVCLCRLLVFGCRDCDDDGDEHGGGGNAGSASWRVVSMAGSAGSGSARRDAPQRSARAPASSDRNDALVDAGDLRQGHSSAPPFARAAAAATHLSQADQRRLG